MQRIGLIGGTSWVSTIDYYRIINKEILHLTGGRHAADMVLYSIDTVDNEKLIANDRWDLIAAHIRTLGISMMAGFQPKVLALASNTMHRVFDHPRSLKFDSAQWVKVAPTLRDTLAADGPSQVLLLGTKSMTQGTVYRDLIDGAWGHNVTIPNEGDLDRLDDMIYNYLCRGVPVPDANQEWLEDLIYSYLGAKVVLACTELGKIVKDMDFIPPELVFDTTEIHAKAIARAAVSKEDLI